MARSGRSVQQGSRRSPKRLVLGVFIFGFAALIIAQSAPQVRGMFPQDMSQQRKKLLASIVLVVRSLRDPERLQNALEEMGRRHHDYGTKPEHYPLVRDTLLDVMAEIAGDAWNDQLQADWTAALNHVAGVMIDAQKQAAAASA